ncbi:hypothetical protein CJ030_MR5G010172 [Morella rubra]|uniref:Uncharacterized protein n=1 Tax=Morella rubra TaxID=262757 RepID=A0A6A1VIX9_9ROSI|nr:hypothetical protein CJ030_MR5G010172 [Morella rubra]
MAPRKKGRGKATGAKFEKLRKKGRIAVQVPAGARGPIGENERLFKERVTYLVRHFIDVHYKSWSEVPKQDKEEIYARILGDFELDWHRHEDQACIKARMAYSFRSIKYHLHKLYKSYATKEKAMAHPPEEVAMPIWEKCCDLWETEAYKRISQRNTINRKKMLVNHTSGSKSLLCSRMEKERMKTLYADRDPTQTSREIAEEVFREVMGSKCGYMRGLGNSVIPIPSPSSRSYLVTQLTQEVERYKSELKISEEKYDTLQNNVTTLMFQLASYHEKIDLLWSERNSQENSQDETLP